MLAVAASPSSKDENEQCHAPEGLAWQEGPSEEMVFLKPGSRAWAEAWKGLPHLAGCVVARNHETGDRWEYVGTYRGHHEFRHRAHAGAGGHPEGGCYQLRYRRLYARVPVDADFGRSLVWTGSPYPDDQELVQLRKDCPLKALCSTGDG